MSALALFADPKPPTPAGIDLRCASIADVLPTVRGAALIVADPPWGEYDQRPGSAAPDSRYPVLSLAEIAAHLDAAYDSAAPGGRLALWYCWPLLEEVLPAVRATRWGASITGGAWQKTGRQGVGFHWLGDSEPVAVYVKRGATPHTDRAENLTNAWSSEPGPHSAKPVGWQRAWLRRWTPPGALVLDLYAGLGTVAEACAIEGRSYVGAEIDPERHAKALGLLAIGGRP